MTSVLSENERLPGKAQARRRKSSCGLNVQGCGQASPHSAGGRYATAPVSHRTLDVILAVWILDFEAVFRLVVGRRIACWPASREEVSRSLWALRLSSLERGTEALQDALGRR